MARKKSTNTKTLQDNSDDMKVERPPRHKPLGKEGVATSSDANTEDVIDCLSKLSICRSDAQIAKSNIIPEKETKEVTSRLIEKEDNGEPEEKKKGQPKEEQKKESDEEAKTKDIKTEEPEAGGLLSRGPVGLDPKWKTEALASALPYTVSNQINSGRTNGGCLVYARPSTTTRHSMPYSNLPSQNLFAEQFTEITQQFDITPLTVSEINDGAPYHQPSYNQNLTTEDSYFPDYSHKTDLNVCEPVGSDCQEEEIIKCIEDITNDPAKVDDLIKSLIPNEYPILPDESPVNRKITTTTAYNIQETGANSFPALIQTQSQVVPQRRTSRSSSSAYSTGSGSPSGPLSPNIYGNVPNFSPNVPSPNVNPYDDSSNFMYSPPYTTTMPSPTTRPQSSCSSVSTNCSELDAIDLDKIFREPAIEEKDKIKVIQEELNSSCSQDYAKFAYSNPNINQIATTNSPLVMVIQGTSNQSPVPRRITSEGISSRTPFRKILPKPSGTSGLTSPGEKSVANQELYMKQSVRPNRIPQCQSPSPKTAKFQLLQKLNPEKMKCAIHKILMLKDANITSVDEDGDTPLMIHIANSNFPDKLEELYALVEKYKTIPGLLALRNKSDQSALYIACMVARNKAYVPKYIAEAMVDINCDLNLRNKKNGATLIHELCRGDDFAPLLDELLSLRDSQDRKCFNINITDYEGRTPLHLAVENHNKGIQSLQLVKVLISHGANVLEKEHKQGSNALHLALATSSVDEKLINLLFQCCDNDAINVVSGNNSEIKYNLVNAKNFNGDTPLHVAMAYGNSIESQTQNYIVDALMKAGAVRAIRNHNGKAPLELAPESRKPEIKKILDKYNSK